MAKVNAALVAFNRGIVSPKALARVDLDRTALSASIMTNWLPKTQGAMRIRPGTKHLGNSLNDTGAEWIEFVAATDDTALAELTTNKMRVWIDDALLGRVPVLASLSLSDTGWSEDHMGGGTKTAVGVNAIPTMTAPTTDGVTMSAQTFKDNDDAFAAWRAADGDPDTFWQAGSGPTKWIQADFGTGNTKRIEKLVLQASAASDFSKSAPRDFTLQGNDVDTGTGWTDEITVSGEASWAAGETRTFTDTGFTDTGANAWQFWRVNVTGAQSGSDVIIAEMKMLQAASTSSDTGQAVFDGGSLTLNAGAIGSLARVKKAVVVDTGDVGLEHALSITVERGPVTLRVGSTDGDDDLVSEASLATGDHNLAFTPPSSPFFVTAQTPEAVDRIVSKLSMSDTGTVELATPWGQTDLDNIRYTQSADVVFVDVDGVTPQQIERRGTGRSWSVVDHEGRFGPFLQSKASSAKLFTDLLHSNATLQSDIPFFRSGHVGALFALTHSGQSGVQKLGAKLAATDAIKVTGIADTGAPSADSERRIVFNITGTYSGTVEIQRSFDSEDFGFFPANEHFITSGSKSDTGTFNVTVDDDDDNLTVWYRAQLTAWNSGTAFITYTQPSSSQTGVVRVTEFTNNQSVEAEVLRRLSDTGATDDWQEGAWSGVRGYPAAVALHDGRLFHSNKSNIWGSESDNFDSHDLALEGDAAPINKTLGSGPVDKVQYLLSLLRLIIGTSGKEISGRSTSIDEVVTPTNFNAKGFSTQGSAPVRALELDTQGIFVQRSKRRLYSIGLADGFSEYATNDLTLLVPDLFAANIVSIAVQRQPDTRIHCVQANGNVAILTFLPAEEVLAWSTYETNGSIERAMVLPGEVEDKVYYHINRTINGSTKRFLERWATEAESVGDTGLSYLADCAASFTDTGRISDPSVWQHLVGESLVVWADDTGQADAGKDLSPDVDGVQTTYAVDTGGGIALSESVNHGVGGLAYTADWQSSKLAFGAQFGTALAQIKRTPQIAFVLDQTHNNGLFFGSDNGNLDPLPRVNDEDAVVDADKIFATYDEVAMPTPDKWDTDARIHLRAKSPRPATVLAIVPSVDTSEKV